MKKITTFFLLLLLPLFVKAQEASAHYELLVNGWLDDAGCGKTPGLWHIYLYFDDGSPREDILDVSQVDKTDFSYDHKYYKDKKITQVEIIHKRQTRRYGVCSRNHWSSDKVFLSSECYSSGLIGGFGATPGEYQVLSYPVVTLKEPGVDNNFGSNDPLIIDPIEGIDDSFFFWEYSIDNGVNFLPLPSEHQYKNYLNIKGDEFLNDTDYGKEIQIRVNTNCSYNYDYIYGYSGRTPDIRSESVSRYSTNVAIYKYLKSAPHIINVEPKGTSCFDSSDGEVKLTFDKPLDPANSEIISITVEDLSKPEDVYDTNGNVLFTRYPSVGGQNNITAFDGSNSVTIDNLPKSSTQFRIVIGGTSNGETFYTEGENHVPIFTIDHNPPVAFAEKPSKVDVWCHGGEDGEVILKAQGGTGENYHYQWRIASGTFSDWIPFDVATSDTQVIKNLAPNTYEYKISDGNLCSAREQVDVAGQIELRDDIIESVEIIAPVKALLLEYTDAKEPTAFGLQDGYIVAKVTGGTIKDDNSYNYVWKDQDDNTLTSITTEYTSGAYYITLNNIGAGTYNLTITDKNYVNATDKEGCTNVDANYFLDQPKPLSVKIEIYEEISCSSSNEYDSEVDDDGNGIPNEAQNGALVAHAEGGIKLNASDNGGLPYFYTWKKKDTDGNWITISQTDSIASNLSVGDYALNIKDKNGVVLGEYVNNALVREIDSTFYLPEPPKLQITTTANQITCASGKNGIVKTVVSGGTPPYTYLWNTGDETDEISNLAAGKYFVYVTDAKGCQIQDNVTIVQPDGINIELVEKIDPTCSYSTDGVVEVAITGGTGPFKLKWNTNETSSRITNLVAGSYELNIIDGNGCNAFFEVTLESATPLEVDLGEDRTLCGGQSIMLDATITEDEVTYNWSGPNGFSGTNPVVEISEAGTYTITVTSLKGCIATDEIEITTKNVSIDASFLLASQAYTNTAVELANVSNPRGESTEWVVPSNAVVIDENEDHITLQFDVVGDYEVSLISFVEDCYKIVTKNILVEENTNLPDVGDADNPFITEFTVYPNPNNGSFKAKIVLKEESAISLRFVNILTNEVIARKDEIGNNEYTIDYNTNLAAGLYFIVLETPEGTETRKVIIQ